jgi:hypothetical protein
MRDEIEEVLDMVIVEAKTAVRGPPADLGGIVDPVDAVILPAQVQRPGSHRVAGPGRHGFGQIGITLAHVRRRNRCSD